MRRETISRWRIFSIVATLLVSIMPAVPVFAQTVDSSTALISIDAPTEGQTFNVGEEMDFGGWAADTAGPGTGVDAVEVVMDGLRGSGGTSLGMATYGSARSDVATAYGNMDLTNTGFNLVWRVSGSSGRHTANIYAHSIANGWKYKAVNINITGGPSAAPRTGQQQPYGPGMGQYGAGYGQGYGQGQYGAGGGGCPYDPNNPTCAGYGNRQPYGGYGQIPPYGGYGGIPPYAGGYGGGYGLGYPGYGYPGIGAGVGYTTTVTVFAPAGGSVTVTWIAIPTAQSYRIYQANAATPSSFTVVQTITQNAGVLTTNATLSGLAAGQLYYVQVRAVDAAGQETVIPASTIGGGYPGAYPGYPPYGVLVAPSGFIVTGRVGSSVTLGWTAVSGAAGYRVYQSIAPGGPFTLLQPTPLGGTTITTTGTTFTAATGLAVSTPVYFQVIAVDGVGNASPPSATVSTATCPTAAAC